MITFARSDIEMNRNLENHITKKILIYDCLHNKFTVYIIIVANILHLHLHLQQIINGNKYNVNKIIIPFSYHSITNRRSICLVILAYYYYNFQFGLIPYTVISE